MKRKLYVILCLFFCFYSLSKAQPNSKIETLEQELSTSESLEDSLIVVQKISKYYQSSGGIDLAIEYGKQYLKLAKKLDVKEKIVGAYADLGWNYKLKSSFDSAISYTEKAIELGRELIPNRSLADGYNTMGSIYNNLSKFDSAIYFHERSLAVKKRISDTVGMAISYNNMGIIFDSKGEYKKSIDSYRKAYGLHEIIGNKQQMADVLNNIGAVYSSRGEWELSIENLLMAIRLYEGVNISGSPLTASFGNLAVNYVELKEYDKAIEYFEKMIEIQEEYGNKYHIAFAINGLATIYEILEDHTSALTYHKKALSLAEGFNEPRSIADILISLGVTYLRLNELELAESNIKRSLKIREEIGDSRGIIRANNRLGDINIQNGKAKIAISFYKKSLSLAKDLESQNEWSKIYEGLYLAYKANKQFNLALASFEKHKALSDSVLNEIKLKNIAELETKYETEKKEQQIALLNKDKELQAAVIESNRIGIIALIVFIFSGIIVVYWLFKRTQYKQKLTLEAEKAKLKEEQVKAIINSQEKERKRFAMDLHDDFGQLLSAMRLNIHSMKETATDTAADITSKSEKLIDNMYSSLKNIAFDLMPHTLFEKGLEEALDELKDQINVSSGLRLKVQSFGIKNKIQGEQKIALYRIIQEFVSNIIKYSDAKNVNISITDHENGLSLMIEDDGLGYDLNAFKNAKGNGWKNIHSRLDLLQGEIEFDTVLGRKNTTISIDIPYEIHEEVIAA